MIWGSSSPTLKCPPLQHPRHQSSHAPSDVWVELVSEIGPPPPLHYPGTPFVNRPLAGPPPPPARLCNSLLPDRPAPPMPLNFVDGLGYTVNGDALGSGDCKVAWERMEKIWGMCLMIMEPLEPYVLFHEEHWHAACVILLKECPAVECVLMHPRVVV